MRAHYKLLSFLLVLILSFTSVSFTFAASPQAATATIQLLNSPPTHLAEGESYTLDVLVQSSQPFALASGLASVYYPAYVHDKGDTAQNATSAVLHVKLTGVHATASLPGGVTPVELVVGVRYKGGQLVVQRFPFNVAVH